MSSKWSRGDILQQKFNLTDEETNRLKQEIFRLSKLAVICIERAGVTFGNAAVDIGVDKNKKIWIIEIQHYLPSVSIARSGEEIYYNKLLHNMLYAKYLSEF